jgi:hypothetical protein
MEAEDIPMLAAEAATSPWALTVAMAVSSGVLAVLLIELHPLLPDDVRLVGEVEVGGDLVGLVGLLLAHILSDVLARTHRERGQRYRDWITHSAGLPLGAWSESGGTFC